MKSFTLLRKRGDRTFHMAPSTAMFSLVTSFVFALIVMLVIVAISAK